MSLLDLANRLLDATRMSKGASSAGLRQRVTDFASTDCRGPGLAKPEIPEPLQTYIKKISEHAYRVTDEDIERLTEAGYSEESLFELTVSAAVGAGIGRLQVGLAALKEGFDAPEDH